MAAVGVVFIVIGYVDVAINMHIKTLHQQEISKGTTLSISG